MAKKKREGFQVIAGNHRVWVVLRKQGTGDCWHATFWFKNKMHWKSTGTPSVTAAEYIAKDKVTEVVEGTAATGCLTLRAAIDKCVAARWPTPESHNQHRKVTLLNLNAFAEISGEDTDLLRIGADGTRKLVGDFIDKRTKQVKPRTVLNEQRKLSRLFAWLMKKKLVNWTTNPASMKLHELPQVTEVVRPPVSPGELVKLLKAAQQSTIWPSVILCLTTGLRPIGTLRIKWDDVNFETRRLTVTEKNRTRVVPLSPWIVGELKAWKEKSTGDHVVDLKDRTLHYWMNKIRKDQGLRPEATLQGCRRTFISNAMDQGLSAELVASVAGNSVAVIEKHYKELSTMDTQSVADKVGDLSALLNGKNEENHSKIHSKEKGDSQNHL